MVHKYAGSSRRFWAQRQKRLDVPALVRHVESNRTVWSVALVALPLLTSAVVAQMPRQTFQLGVGYGGARVQPT